jgi:asparagine synthase (glutamine-hydrolysing)
MCGITGFLSTAATGTTPEDVVCAMTGSLQHRGPDAKASWFNAAREVFLGHTRLSILDLSPTGSQPMSSASGRYTITFNGEIYNFGELRRELQAADVMFRGTSDTEVLVEAVNAWGVTETLPRLNGMFAFAVWDEHERCLWLARDRFGEKPLYYGWHQGVFLFGSELKALTRHPAFERRINYGVLPLYLRFNYVPWPHSIFQNTWKLPPAHVLKVVPGASPPPPQPYWAITSLARNAREDANPVEVVDALERHLRRAVKMRMVSDVPLGAFLSGGIDSSTVVAMMQAESTRAVKTFTIGFWEAPYNEADDAARVARHLGTEHHELYVSSRECVGIIARLPEIYDEPFADSSQIPTAIVSEFTRRHVTVALSGDAGDELFGGYNRYFWSARLWPKLRGTPLGVRDVMAKFIGRWTPASWDKFFSLTNRTMPASFRVRGGGEKMHKVAAAMLARSSDELYYSYVSQWQEPSAALTSGTDDHELWRLAAAIPESLHFVERMMFLDLQTYLPSDILCKVDRAAMSVGLETRVPFLDNDLVDFAWSLPLSAKIHKGVGKWPLRCLLKRYLPESSFERPKAGFGIPIGDWLRTSMRDWAESQLSEERLRSDGLFRPDVVRRQWSEHLSGRRNLQHSLWSIIMFQAWLEKWN